MKIERRRSYSMCRGRGLLRSITAVLGKLLNGAIDILLVELHFQSYLGLVAK